MSPHESQYRPVRTTSEPARRRGTLRYADLKRVVDVIGATLLLLLCAPILLICIAAVFVDSGRPVIHKRRVLGRGARSFDALKIRTMVPDADRVLAEDDGLRRTYAVANKLSSDPRITGSGRWLRRFSLDEVPQLINVLRGEMSLVGPRMITACELADWGETAELVLSVRPGMTGLWQVSGRQNVRKSDRVRLDGDYVRRMSLRLDVTILARTVPAVLSGRGAF